MLKIFSLHTLVILDPYIEQLGEYSAQGQKLRINLNFSMNFNYMAKKKPNHDITIISHADSWISQAQALKRHTCSL